MKSSRLQVAKTLTIAAAATAGVALGVLGTLFLFLVVIANDDGLPPGLGRWCLIAAVGLAFEYFGTFFLLSMLEDRLNPWRPRQTPRI